MPSNLAYQEESWDEMMGGKIIAMSPRPTVTHNLIADNISRITGAYLNGKACTPFGDGTDLFLTKKDRFVPDGMIVCDKDKIGIDGVHGAPDLIVEVLSPSTATYDRGHKKEVYEACGVREYWIVSPLEKTVEVYVLKNGRYFLQGAYALYPDGLLGKMTDEERAAIVTEFTSSLFDDFVIRLEDVFQRVV